MMSQSVEQICREIYAESRCFYNEKASQLGSNDHGFRILYGPPISNAKVLFIGYQPGGGADSASEGIVNGEHEGWPQSCDYAVAPWKLANRIREIWNVSTLQSSTGLNAVFFRSPSVSAWRTVPRSVRAEVESFSLRRVVRITEALLPQMIVVIGIGTFDRLTKGEIAMRGEKGQALVKRGELWGWPAFGVVHLSGARVSRNDMTNSSPTSATSRRPKQSSAAIQLKESVLAA